MRLSTTLTLTATALGVWFLSAVTASAEQNTAAGLARISDGPASAQPVPLQARSTSHLGPGEWEAHGDWEVDEGDFDHLDPDPHHHKFDTPLHVWLCHHGACTYSPDHGWAPPVKRPIARIPVEYRRYWPAKWYGEPGWGLAGRFPMVYQPTDTTQLGFYYQRVPTWRPRPGMIPPPPKPALWHDRDCPAVP